MRRLGIGPLLFRALHHSGDRRAGELELDFRAATARNLLVVATVSRARDLLLARGIAPVLFKGGAFLLRHSPRDLGIRAIADLDLLVGPARFDEAFAHLGEAGWKRTNPEMKYSSRVAPAVTVFRDAGGLVVQLDLHRRLAQWPLLRPLPARVIAGAERVGGWLLCNVPDAALIIALHRARHAFANDARDLLDLVVCSDALDDEAWDRLTGAARGLGLTGALYGAMCQAAWWFGREDDAVTRRASGLRARLGGLRAALVCRMADPAFALTRASPWMGPAGRNFAVFPAALHAPLSSLVAAAVFLPRRVAEGGRPVRSP